MVYLYGKIQGFNCCRGLVTWVVGQLLFHFFLGELFVLGFMFDLSCDITCMLYLVVSFCRLKLQRTWWFCLTSKLWFGLQLLVRASYVPYRYLYGVCVCGRLFALELLEA